MKSSGNDSAGNHGDKMKEIRKSTFREIKSSFGRFMAIFAIIALGVGFFSGLKVTKKAMVATMNGYLDNHSFYDFRLLSTLGFEQEDVDFFRAQEDVEAAEGAVNIDVLYTTQDGSQGVLKAYSLPEYVNTLETVAGRLPEKSDECVIDSRLMGEERLGSTICLSETNEEETKDCFSHMTYTVVGVVQSPLYLQYERGNTSLGTGRTDGFFYLPSSGFSVEYYTDIYVRFKNSPELYSDAYEDMVKGRKENWETLTNEAADRRYCSIVKEAEDELDDARLEFENKKKEGEEELADAAKKLADAQKELTDGEQALEDAKNELADAEKTLSDKKSELEDAKITLAEKKQEFSDAERELNEKTAEWKTNDDAVEDGKRQLNEGFEQLNQKRQELEAEEARLQAVIDAMGGAITTELQMGLAQVQAGYAALQNAENTLREKEAELMQADRQLSEIWWNTLVPAKEELEVGRQELADAEIEIEDGEKAIRDAGKELEEARETLAEKEKELEDAKVEYQDGRKEYEDASKEFEEKIVSAEAELADAEKAVSEIEKPEVFVLGRDTNTGYVCFENDSSIVEGIADIFPVFFFLVAALVCITTMNRMVEEQRIQVGVLKALGYGELTIMSKYMTYSGLAAVTGCISGFFLGTKLFPMAIWAVYGIMYDAIPLRYLFSPGMAILSLIVSLVCSVGTTWMSCRVELSETAAGLMRPRSPKAGKRVFLEYLPFLWKRLSFLRKVSLRNIFRYKKRLFMMIVGIGGCTALLVTGFGIKDSISDVAERQFTEIQIYDIGVDIRDTADESLKTELTELKASGLEEFTCVMEKTMDLVTDEGVKSIYLVAGEPENMEKFVNLHTQSGEQIAYPGVGEGVISNSLAEQYGIRPGDTIVLRDENMRTISLNVSAVHENYINNYVYISEESWEAQTGEKPELKKLYMNLAESADPHTFSAALLQMEEISNVTVNADICERIGNMMSSLDIIVLVVIFCAAGLAFVVLYNLTNINITERIREIATIKVLGFYKKETNDYVFRENILLTVMGMLLGFVMGHFLHLLVMDQIKIDLIDFRSYVKPVSYVYSGILTLLFTWLVNLSMRGKLENISMTESLKSVD